MSHNRHWEGGHWISDAPLRLCQVCGVVVAKRPGMGGPFRYCPDHAPADRAAAAKWYGAHREERRDYNRWRDGSQPLVASICADCGKPYRTRIGSPVCSPCRAIAKNAAISRQNLLARVMRDAIAGPDDWRRRLFRLNEPGLCLCTAAVLCSAA